MPINLNQVPSLLSNSAASPYGDYQSTVDSAMRAAEAIQAIKAQRGAAPEPSIGTLGNTPFDSVNPVKDDKQVADGVMRIAESFRADPAQFAEFRDKFIVSNQKVMDTLKRHYDPEYLNLYFSDKVLPSAENRLRKATEDKTIEMQSDLKAQLANKDDLDVTAKQKAFRAAFGKKAEVTTTLEMAPELEQLAVKDAIIKENAKKAAAESPSGIANAQAEIGDYKQKRDILQGVQQESFKQKQQKRQADIFNGKYITMYKDYAPDGVPDEEGFGAKFVGNTGHSSRNSEKPMEELINSYRMGKVSAELPEEVETKYKTAEQKMFVALILGKSVDASGKAVPMDEAEKEDLIQKLKASPVLGGTPSPYYFAYNLYKSGTTVSKKEQGFFDRLFKGKK